MISTIASRFFSQLARDPGRNRGRTGGRADAECGLACPLPVAGEVPSLPPNPPVRVAPRERGRCLLLRVFFSVPPAFAFPRAAASVSLEPSCPFMWRIRRSRRTASRADRGTRSLSHAMLLAYGKPPAVGVRECLLLLSFRIRREGALFFLALCCIRGAECVTRPRG